MRALLLALVSIGLILVSRIPVVWEPVEEPIALAEYDTVAASFEGRPDARYWIEIAADSGPGVDCLLGIRRVPSDGPCPDEGGRLDVTWTVRADGAVETAGTMADYPGSSSGTRGTSAAVLDHFGGRDDATVYDVVVAVATPSPVLAQSNPRVVVGVGGGTRHRDLFLRVLAFYGGAAGLLSALVVTLMGVWRRRERG